MSLEIKIMLIMSVAFYIWVGGFFIGYVAGVKKVENRLLKERFKKK